ncbi:MAG: HEAT repeat domain-containing protein [archaeon]
MVDLMTVPSASLESELARIETLGAKLIEDSDIGARLKIREELKTDSQNHKFYSVRYKATLLLGTNHDKLIEKLDEYLSPLKIALSFSNPTVRTSAIKDLKKLYELSGPGQVKKLLEYLYTNADFDDVRVEAGKSLGYGKAKLMFRKKGRA